MTKKYLDDARVIALIHLKQFDKPSDEQIRAAAIFAASAYKDIDVTGLFEDLKYTLEITSEEFKQIQDTKTYAPWLSEARDGINWNFWRRYREYLRKSMAPDSIGELNRMTDAVLNNLFNPAIPGPHDRRGMVVGHVQSGKTGNYTGLVCKAADAGFRFIIILTGMTSDLRNQTQNRIDAGFIGRKTQSGSESGQNYIGVGADPKTRGRDYWLNNLTSSGLDGDFKQSEAKKYNSDFDGGIPIIAIVKKNGPVLANLIKWLAGRASYSEEQGYVIRNMPALIIDDEADNASVNTKYVLEGETTSTPGALKSRQETTTINSSIRALLMLFEQRAYVGYTATPFANIYIPVLENALLTDVSLTLKGLKRGGVTDKKAPDYPFPLGQDLFPQHFIVNLSAPSNYVGPHRIFGMTDEDESSLLPVFVGVDDYELLIPDRHKKGNEPPKKLPESLKKAIKCFVLTCAIRRVRGQDAEHNSMLVHVSRFNRVTNNSLTVVYV